jgi:hypothetical protein
MKVIVFVAGLLALTCMARSESPHTAPGHPGSAAIEEEASGHADPSADASWARPVVIGILAMFAAAVAAGLLTPVAPPEAPPQAHAHDEPPGSAGAHHGH